MAAGFALGDAVGLSRGDWVPGILVAACVLALFLLLKRIPFRMRTTITLLLLFAFLGWGRAWISQMPGPNDVSQFASGLFLDCTGIVDGDPQRTPSGWNVILDTE